MKKVLGLSLAAVLVAGAAAPSFAAEVELSGEVRVRHEIMSNFDFDDSTGGSRDASTQRTRINAKATVDDRTTAFISLQDTRKWGEETNTASTGNEPGNGNIDLSQGYLLIDDLAPSTALLVGRFPLSYGNQRYVGSFEWSDNARRFDGLAFLYKSDMVDIDLAFTQVGLGTGTDEDSHVNALYTKWKVIPGNQLDVYGLQISGAGGTDIQTLGARIAGKAAGADWTAEYIMEGGDAEKVGTTVIEQDANAMAITAGYTLPGVLGGLRIGGEYTSASGDKENSTNTNGAFSGGLPTNKFHYGLTGGAKYDGGRNLDKWSDFDAISLNLTAKPAEGMKIRAEYWDFTENEVTSGSSDDIGSEINLQFVTSLTEKVKFLAHVAQFSPGKAVVGTGKDDKANLITLQLHAKF